MTSLIITKTAPREVKPGDKISVTCKLEKESPEETGTRKVTLLSEAFDGGISPGKIFSMGLAAEVSFTGITAAEGLKPGETIKISYTCDNPNDPGDHEEKDASGEMITVADYLPKAYFPESQPGLESLDAGDGKIRAGEADIMLSLSRGALYDETKITVSYGEENYNLVFAKGETEKKQPVLFTKSGRLELSADKNCSLHQDLSKTRKMVRVKPPELGIAEISATDIPELENCFHIGEANLKLELTYKAPFDLEAEIRGEGIIEKPVPVTLASGEMDLQVPVNLLDTGGELRQIQVVKKDSGDDRFEISRGRAEKQISTKTPTLSFTENAFKSVSLTMKKPDLYEIGKVVLEAELDFLPPEGHQPEIEITSPHLKAPAAVELSEISSSPVTITLDNQPWEPVTPGATETEFTMDAKNNCHVDQEKNKIPAALIARLHVSEIFGKKAVTSEKYQGPFFFGDTVFIIVRAGETVRENPEKFKLKAEINESDVIGFESEIAVGEQDATCEIFLGNKAIKELKQDQTLDITIETLSGACRGTNHEAFLTGDENSLRSFTVSPFPSLVFDDQEPVVHCRDKKENKKGDYFQIVNPKQEIRLKLSQPLPQQKLTVKISNAPIENKKNKLYDIMPGDVEAFINPGEQEITVPGTEFRNTAKWKPSTKKIQAVITSRECGSRTIDEESPPCTLPLRFKNTNKINLYWGTGSCSHTISRLVAGGDQIWIRMQRDAKVFPEDGDITIKCKAFSDDPIPVFFKRDSRVSHWIELAGGNGYTLTTEENNEKSKGLVVRKDVEEGLYPVTCKASKKHYRKKFDRKLIINVQKDRVAHFTMQSVENMSKANPGDIVSANVRLSAPAGLFNIVSIKNDSGNRKLLENDYLVPFKFGQSIAEVPVKLLPDGDEYAHREQSIKLTVEKGNMRPSLGDEADLFPCELTPRQVSLGFAEERAKGFGGSSGSWDLGDGEKLKCTTSTGKILELNFESSIHLPMATVKDHEFTLESNLFDEVTLAQLPALPDNQFIKAGFVEDKKQNFFKVSLKKLDPCKTLSGRNVHMVRELIMSQKQEHDRIPHADITSGHFYLFEVPEDSEEEAWIKKEEITKDCLYLDMSTEKLVRITNALEMVDIEPFAEGMICHVLEDGVYYRHDGCEWKVLRESLESDIITDSIGKYHTLEENGGSLSWKETGDIADGDHILDFSEGFGCFRFESGRWQKVERKTSFSVPVCIVSEEPQTGEIRIKSKNIICNEEANSLGVQVFPEKPMVFFRRKTGDETWIKPETRTFAVGDPAEIHVEFSCEVSEKKASDSALKICGIGLSVPPAHKKRPADSYIDHNGKYRKWVRDHWEEDGDVTENDCVINLGQGKECHMAFEGGKWLHIPVVHVMGAYLKSEDGKYGKARVTQDPVTKGWSARVNFCNNEGFFTKFGRFFKYRRTGFAYEDTRIYIDAGDSAIARDMKASSTLLGLHKKRYVSLEKDPALTELTYLEDERVRIKLNINLPAPLGGASVTLAGDFFETLPPDDTENDFAKYDPHSSGETEITIPEGKSFGFVDIKFTGETFEDGKAITLKEITDKGYCVLEKKKWEPVVFVGSPKIKSLGNDEQHTVKVGGSARIVLELERPAPTDCHVTLKEENDSFEEKILQVLKGESYGFAEVNIIRETPVLKVATKDLNNMREETTCEIDVLGGPPLQLKITSCGSGKPDNQAETEDYKDTDISIREVVCDESLSISLKNEDPDEDVTCQIKSSAFGATVYSVTVPKEGEKVQKVEAVVPGDHIILVCDPRNSGSRLVNRKVISLAVEEKGPVSSCSPASQPTEAVVREAYGQKEFFEEILDNPCNLHSIKLTVMKDGKPAENRGDDGSFFVSAQASLIKDKTKKPLVCDTDKFPVIQVIAGMDGDIYEEEDRKNHDTSIEVDLNQPEGFKFCRASYRYEGVSAPVTHPALILQERYSDIKGYMKKGESERVLTAKELKLGISPGLATPAPDLPGKEIGKLRKEREKSWYPYTPAPVRKSRESYLDEKTTIEPYSFRVYRASQKALAFTRFNRAQQYYLEVQSCGHPDTTPPASEPGPVQNLHAVIEVFPSVEHCVKIGNAPDSALYSIGHEGKFFDPEQGFNPDKGFDPELKAGLKSVEKGKGAASEEELRNKIANLPSPQYEHKAFQQEIDTASFKDPQGYREQDDYEAPESSEICDHLSFFNSLTVPQETDRQVKGETSEYLFYPVDEHKKIQLPGALETGKKVAGHIFQAFKPEGGAWAEEEASTDLHELEDGDDTYYSPEAGAEKAFENYYEDQVKAFGSGDVSATDRAEKILDRNWLGYLPSIHVARNGKPWHFFEVSEWVLNMLKTVQSIAVFVLKIINNFENVKFGWGFGFNFHVGFMEGEILTYWGWKEYKDARVFPWQYTIFNSRLLAVSAEGTFGAGFAWKGLGFAAMVFLKLEVDFLADFSFETVPFDDDSNREHIKKVSDMDLLVSGGIKAFAVSDSIVSLCSSITSGIKFRTHWAPVFRSEIYHLGIKANIEIKMALATKEMEWVMVKPQTEDLPMLTCFNRGLGIRDPYSILKSQHAVTISGKILESQKRRLAMYFRMYQTLQLNMYISGGHSPRTYTLPGYTPLEPDSGWKSNKDLWDIQWQEVTRAFKKEDFTVWGRKSLRRYRLKLRLVHKEKRITEDLVQIEKRLQEIESFLQKQKNLEKVVAAGKKKGEEMHLSERAKLLKDAERHFSEVKSLRKRHVKSGFFHYNSRLFKNIQTNLKDLHHYALLRKHH